MGGVNLTQEQYDYQMARYDENKQPLLIGVYTMLIVLSTTSIILRLFSRKIKGLKLGADDYWIIVAGIMHLGFWATYYITIVAGTGRHEVAVTEEQTALYAKQEYGGNLLYTICWPSTKISILFLYKRVFVTRNFRRVCWFFLGILFLYIFSTVLTDIFSCWPIRRVWDKTVPGGCINSLLLYRTTAGANVALDVIILILPLPQIWKLTVSTANKIGLTTVFSLGILAVICSIMRIITTGHIVPWDRSWTFVIPNLWTAAELAISIICACLPCIVPVALVFGSHCKHLFSSLSGKSPMQSKDMPSATSSNTTAQSSKRGTADFEKPPSNKARGVYDEDNLSSEENILQPAQIQANALVPQNKRATVIAKAKGTRKGRFDEMGDEEKSMGVPAGQIGVESQIEWRESPTDGRVAGDPESEQLGTAVTR